MTAAKIETMQSVRQGRRMKMLARINVFVWSIVVSVIAVWVALHELGL